MKKTTLLIALMAVVMAVVAHGADCPLWGTPTTENTMEWSMVKQADFNDLDSLELDPEAPAFFDLTDNGMPDRWEYGLLISVVCDPNHPHHAGAVAAWDANLAVLESCSATFLASPVYGIKLNWAALVTISQANIDYYLTSAGAVGGNYLDNCEGAVAPYTTAKAANEPFSPEGDLDGDGQTNAQEAAASATFEEYIVNAGGGDGLTGGGAEGEGEGEPEPLTCYELMMQKFDAGEAVLLGLSGNAAPDKDENGIEDRWEEALLAQAYCSGDAGVIAAFDANLAVEMATWGTWFPDGGIAEVFAAYATFSQTSIDRWTGYALMFGGEVPYTEAKAANEPLSPEGDYDGDGYTNLEEAQAVSSAEEYAIAASGGYAGPGVPVAGLAGLALLAIGLAGAVALKKK